MTLLRAAFLLFAVLLGQVHACETTYALPNGQVCLTCPTEVCAFNDNQTSIPTSAESDCHLCCTLKPCDKDPQDHSFTSSVPQLDLWLPIPIEVPVFVPAFVGTNVTIHVAQQYANAPPSLNSSRAPPSLLT